MINMSFETILDAPYCNHLRVVTKYQLITLTERHFDQTVFDHKSVADFIICDPIKWQQRTIAISLLKNRITTKMRKR
jgi:hypothetical protein